VTRELKGTEWTLEATGLNTVWCISASSCVGTDGGGIETWDGSSWTAVSNPDGSELSRVVSRVYKLDRVLRWVIRKQIQICLHWRMKESSQSRADHLEAVGPESIVSVGSRNGS
jgi:hypothetical protein